MIGAVIVGTLCLCGIAKERSNDFFWENDKFGMRAYGPGEWHKWSGFDVFNKATDENAVADILTHPNERGDWHRNVNGKCFDNYTMGASRGVGGIAMFADGEWKTFPDWEMGRVITNCDDYCEFELIYPAFSAAGKMTCHITLRRGERFYRNDVSFERMPDGFLVGPGIDLDPKRDHAGSLVETPGRVSLFEQTKPEDEGSTMTAILVADPTAVTVMTDHMNCRVLAFKTKSFTYWAGASWSKAGEIVSPEEWHDHVKYYQSALMKGVAAPVMPEEKPLTTFDAWPEGCDPAEVGRRIAEQFLSSSPECYRPIGYEASPGAPRWAGTGYGDMNYPVANLWNAALEFARLAGDRALERKLTWRFEPYLTTRKFATERIGHVDHDVFGAVPLEIAILCGDTRAAALGLRFADRQWKAPEKGEPISNGMFDYEERLALHRRGLSPQTRFWIDDMFMINSLQTQAYRLTGDRKYVDRAAAEMCEYIDRLQLANGLFYHAADVPFVWGRGAGWMAAGMPLILKYLPDDSPHRLKILAACRKMMASLLKLQRTSGLWGQLVDDPESWDETSGSAMFAYGMAEGVRQGWLDATAYAPAVRRAWIALCAKLDERANLRDVCIATNKLNDRNHYMKRPTTKGDPHGQAPMLWCCAALIGGDVKVAKPKTQDVCLRSAVRFLEFLPRHIREVPGDGTVAYYGTGEAGHWSVQCNQQVACALACLSEVPAGELRDTGATMTADEMRRLAVRLFRYSFRTHLTGDLKCTDGSSWGRHWISVLGIERATPGLNILKKSGFTDEDLCRLRTIMESECDYRLKEYPIECAIDNFQWKNKPESNIWNGGVMLRAAAEYPDAVNAEGWVKKGERMLFNGLTVPSDAGDPRFVGANFTPNWSLDHHGYMNTGYAYVCLSNLAFLHFNFKDLGAKPPELLYRNVPELWKRLKLMTFDDGRLFRVGGDSRVRWTYCQLFAMQAWALLADRFGDADARRYEEGVVGMMAAEQSYGDDGSFFGRRLADLRGNAPVWANRLEADAFFALAVADRWHRKYLGARSAAPVAHTGEETWSDDFHQAALIRSPEAIRSVCLRAATHRACALCVPADRSDLAEWQCNLFGFIGGNIVSDYRPGRRDEQDAKTRMEFFTENGRTGFVWRCDAPITETVPLAEGQKPFVFARREATVTALADGRTLRVADKVTITKDTTLREGFRALHLQVPNDWPNGCFRNYYTKDGFWLPALAFDDGTLKDELVETGKRELMIDGRLHVRLLRGTDLKILRHARRNIEVSWTPQLRGSRTDEIVSDCALGPVEKRAGEVLYDVEYEVSVMPPR